MNLKNKFRIFLYIFIVLISLGIFTQASSSRILAEQDGYIYHYRPDTSVVTGIIMIGNVPGAECIAFFRFPSISTPENLITARFHLKFYEFSENFSIEIYNISGVMDFPTWNDPFIWGGKIGEVSLSTDDLAGHDSGSQGAIDLVPHFHMYFDISSYLVGKPSTFSLEIAVLTYANFFVEIMQVAHIHPEVQPSLLLTYAEDSIASYEISIIIGALGVMSFLMYRKTRNYMKKLMKN